MILISKEILHFLKELKNNNNRDWFEENKGRFRKIQDELKLFAQQLSAELSESDAIDKAKIFRIYRDVRFSKDKTPYKTSFGITLNRQKPQFRGGYYVHIEPGNSFLATGFWTPSKEDLLTIRKAIQFDGKELKEIINEPDFKKIWGNLEGDEVKTAPKGFSKEAEHIDFIKKKQFVFTRKISDSKVLDKNYIKEITTSFEAIRPFFDFMTELLTVDSNGEKLKF